MGMGRRLPVWTDPTRAQVGRREFPPQRCDCFGGYCYRALCHRLQLRRAAARLEMAQPAEVAEIVPEPDPT